MFPLKLLLFPIVNAATILPRQLGERMGCSLWLLPTLLGESPLRAISFLLDTISIHNLTSERDVTAHLVMGHLTCPGSSLKVAGIHSTLCT